MALLQALVRADERLQSEGRPSEFVLFRMAGARLGLAPGVEGEQDLQPTEADLIDLEEEGYLHRLRTTSQTVIVKFALSASGREAGRPRAVSPNVGRPPADAAPPSLDDVLRWLAGLEDSGRGAAILADGGALRSEAMAQFEGEHLPTVTRRLFDLRAEGLLLFEDPGASLQQLSDA
ncbi:MAG: hypothetical protein M3198_14820, partial [Actinomycetota bacterium]|nr:hypothetical protein [Actinomycetota bacterium]